MVLCIKAIAHCCLTWFVFADFFYVFLRSRGLIFVCINFVVEAGVLISMSCSCDVGLQILYLVSI